MNIMNIRKVRIVDNNGMYFVVFNDRKKYQKHLAGQFDKKFTSINDVVAWVKSNPKLILDDEYNHDVPNVEITWLARLYAQGQLDRRVVRQTVTTE